MENFLSLLESVDTSWLTPSFTTWAMDVILAFVCGLGIFHLLLPFLPVSSTSPPPAENITAEKVVKRAHSKVKKKYRILKGRLLPSPGKLTSSPCPRVMTTNELQNWKKQLPGKNRELKTLPSFCAQNDALDGYRGSRKKPREDKALVSVMHSMQRRLVNALSFCQQLRQDTLVSNREGAKIDQPTRQPTEETVDTNLYLAHCSAPLKEHLLPKDSKILSPVRLNAPASIESQLSGSASQLPETLTPGRCCSPPRAHAHTSHPPDPVAYPPSMSDSRMEALKCDQTSLGTTQSTPLPGSPSPIPSTIGLNHVKRPNRVTPGINQTCRPTLAIPALNNACRPTQTTTGLEYPSRPSPTTPGCYNSGWPTSATPGHDQTSRPSSKISCLNKTCLPNSTSAGLKNSCKPTSNMPGHENSISPTPNSPDLNPSNRPVSTTIGLKNTSRPTLTTWGLDQSSRPTSTAGSLDKSSRPTSSSPGLLHSIKPTSTTADFNYLNRATSTSLGLDQSNSSVSVPSWSNKADKSRCHSNSSHPESWQGHLSITLQEPSIWIGPSYRQIEAGELTFIKPDVQQTLEYQINKKVELKVWKDNGKSDNVLCCIGNMLESWRSKENTATSRRFWSPNSKSEQFSGHHQFCYQKVSGNHVQVTYSQYFWGLPFLHSESLVATVNMAQSTLGNPSILFNGFSPYIPIQLRSDVPRRLIPPKPLLQHIDKSQPLTTKISDTRAPMAGIQTQACDTTSLQRLPCHSFLDRNNAASYINASRYQDTKVPPAVQHLEQHILNKLKESRNNLPDRVRKSQEAFLELTSKSQTSQHQVSLVHLPGEISDPELQELLEQHLKNRFFQLHGKSPHKGMLPLDLIKPQDQPHRMGQAKVNHETECPSTLKDGDSQHPQRVSPKFPDLAQLPRDPCKNITNCPETVRKNLERSPVFTMVNVREIVSNIELESSYRRHPRSDKQNVSPVGPGKQHLEGTQVIHSSSKCKRIDHSKISMEKTSFRDVTTFNQDSNGPSFLDRDTQRVLEKHLTRLLVRHRWSLPLRGLKTIHVFQRNKATTPSPFPQPSNGYLSFGDSGDDFIPTNSSVPGELLQQAPEVRVMRDDSHVESTQTSPPVLQLELLRDTLYSDNPVPSEASTTIKEDSLTALSTRQDLIGRAWHRNNVPKSSIGNPEPTADLVRGMGLSAGNEHGSLGDIYQRVRNNSSVSQSPSSRTTRELEEVEEDSCEWALTKSAGELANTSSNNSHLRDFESLKITESPTSSRTNDHMPEDSGLATRHCLAPGVVLQDCATGVYLQDCAREVLLAADIMASRASQSSSKTKSTTRTSISQDRYLFPSREGTVPKKSKSQEPWTSHNFGENYQKKDDKSPRQNLCNSGKRPAQAAMSHNHEKKIADTIKNFVLSIFNPKGKVQQNSIQNVKATSSPTQSRDSVASRVFMPQKVTEAQDLKTSARWVPTQKHGVHHRCPPSNNLQEPTKASMSRHACNHRIPTVESKITQGNTNCVQQDNSTVRSHPSTYKWRPYGNTWAQVVKQPVPQHAISKQMAQVPREPGTPVHCPRHCCFRGVYHGKASASSNLK